MLCTIFKICSQVSENAIFEKIVKNLRPQNFNFLSDFRFGQPSCSNAHIQLAEILVKEIVFFKRCVFTFCAPKTKHYQITNLNFDKLKFMNKQIYCYYMQ